MAEILGLGLTHYPGVAVAPEHWSKFLVRRTQAGQVPAAVFEDRAGWPAPMREEWGTDEGAAAAEAHRTRLLAAARRLRAALDAFAPDLVVIWGDDQYENFRSDCIPAFSVYIFDETVSHPYNRTVFGDVGNAWDLPPATELVVRGHREAARELSRFLLGDGFDIAYAYATRNPHGLAHSFNNAILYLDFDRKGFDHPVIPFHVNCYGNRMLDLADGGPADLAPPSPSPRRCFDIGAATARFFAASPWRVALIASSSWSHANLTAKTDWLYPDIPSDRERLAELESGAFAGWRDIDIGRIEDAGQHEFLNWVCLAGAMTETGQRFETVDFVESYLFNSSKCFGLFRPA